MCQFFSFVTDPINHPAEYYYFDWEYRKANLEEDDADSHSHICAHFRLDEDRCNKYEFDPLTKRFEIDQINSERDDSKAAEKWAQRLDFKTIIEPLIIKPIVNPLGLPKVEQVTDEQIGWLKVWASVSASVWASVGASVGASVWASVWDSVWASVWDSVWASVWDSVGSSVWALVGASVRDLVGSSVWASVWASVWDSVWDSVWAYFSSFFAIDYEHDFSSAVKLWEAGLVPSFDGRTWRLHSGKDARVVYEWTPDKEREE
jgi:hypothetical protein